MPTRGSEATRAETAEPGDLFGPNTSNNMQRTIMVIDRYLEVGVGRGVGKHFHAFRHHIWGQIYCKFVIDFSSSKIKLKK